MAHGMRGSSLKGRKMGLADSGHKLMSMRDNLKMILRMVRVKSPSFQDKLLKELFPRDSKMVKV